MEYCTETVNSFEFNFSILLSFYVCTVYLLCVFLVCDALYQQASCAHSYDDRIDKVETAIAAKLRDQLGTAKSANEMFNIFSRYNALFVRPHIRGAIKEYQSQLIQKVKDDIEGLHSKFKVCCVACSNNMINWGIVIFCTKSECSILLYAARCNMLKVQHFK